MPLARIISSSAEDSQVLAKQLRTRGFAVETMSLDATPNAPADLEIRLEDYAFHEALKIANKTPDGTDLCVFITPSAITGSARLVRVTRLTAEAAEGVRREEPGQTEDRSQETAPAQVEPVPEGETLKQGSTQEVFSQAVPSGLESGSEQLSEVVQMAEPVASSSAQPVAQTDVDENFFAFEERGAAVGESESAIVSENATIPSGQEGAVISCEETLGAEWLPEPVNPTPGVEALVPRRGESGPGSFAPVSLQMLRRLRRYVVRRGAGLGADGLFWRTATGLAAAALLVLTLGATVLRFTPGGLLQSSASAGQQVPFAPAVIATNSEASRAAAATGSVSPKMRSKPVRSRVHRKPAVLPTKFNTTAGRPAKRRATSAEAGIVAKDTVIHYGRRPAPPPVKVQKKPGIKRYSDLD